MLNGNLLKKVFVVIVILITMMFSINAQINETITPYWTNTRRVVMSHTYESGNAPCFIEITGISDVDSIQNVDIEFSVNIDGDWVQLASWEDLSAVGNVFQFDSIVRNVYLGYTYRLSFCADVHRNGTIEWLTDYYDVTY